MGLREAQGQDKQAGQEERGTFTPTSEHKQASKHTNKMTKESAFGACLGTRTLSRSHRQHQHRRRRTTHLVQPRIFPSSCALTLAQPLHSHKHSVRIDKKGNGGHCCERAGPEKVVNHPSPPSLSLTRPHHHHPSLPPSLPPSLEPNRARVIVTGFGPFRGVADNPTQHLIEALREDQEGEGKREVSGREGGGREGARGRSVRARL